MDDEGGDNARQMATDLHIVLKSGSKMQNSGMTVRRQTPHFP